MTIRATSPAQGLQFPGTFEISAMGAAGEGLDAKVCDTLEAAGLPIHRDQLRERLSSKGNWVSVTVGFDAAHREDYDRAHAALRALPGVKWTL